VKKREKVKRKEVRRSLRRSKESKERSEKSLKKFKRGESEKTWPKKEHPDSAEKMTISAFGL
jgi:hypothetical protein